MLEGYRIDHGLRTGFTKIQQPQLPKIQQPESII